MDNDKKERVVGGCFYSTFWLVMVIVVTLKLESVIDWSWWVIATPFLVMHLVLLTIFALALVALLLDR